MLDRVAAVLLMSLLAVPAPALAGPAEPADTGTEAAAPAGSTVEDLLKQIEEQKALLEEQKERIARQDETLEEQREKLALLEEQILMLTRRLEEIQGELPSAEFQKAIEERLAKVEKTAERVPELPQDVVSAGDFPGSIRIPGTDAAIKFGGRIRTAAVFTLGPLGSEDRFLTNSIPVEGSEEAGKGRRTTFSANTSRLNFELRTPTGVGQMRAFIEGDFFGVDNFENRTTFRLRHAYAQYRGFIVGQTWSTFSDPETDLESLDFEGVSSENVIRQAQFRYWWSPRPSLRAAVAAETPRVSITGGEGVNVIPDLVGRLRWSRKENSHLQTAIVLRQIRGESEFLPGQVLSTAAWGATLSGVFPLRFRTLEDRFLFQVNVGKGNARYINDLNSLGGQDAVLNPVSARIDALPAFGYYVDYEHQWKEWESTKRMRLRSSLIYSYVRVDNLEIQTGDAYRNTHRISGNLVFSPIERINLGVEYIYGTRENKDGAKGSSDQVQFVGIFRF